MVRPHRRKWAAVLIGSGACLAYWVLLLVNEHAGIYTMLPVPILAWSPNIAFALLASGLAWQEFRPAS
jgi:lipopolysaccharide export LptBFGC system permease protein LptF